MNYILFDSPTTRANLLPFTFTRPIADIRVGIRTIREKWEGLLHSHTSTATVDYLAAKWPSVCLDKNIYINASFLPSENLVRIIKGLNENQAIFGNGELLAFHAREDQEFEQEHFEVIEYTHGDLLQLRQTWDIFAFNHEAIRRDFEWLTGGRTSEPIPQNTVAFNEKDIFIEEGAQLPLCALNASDGPIYIGKDSLIMEGAMIRGPFALCEGAIVKMGAKIYGGTTVGPYSKIGGEVNNSVLFGYSNKGHDGFLGNSVLGEWCNIGADTNTSNMKNNYAEVRLWNYSSERFESTGRQFCGLMMGDHSKCGINTMFNTGTVVGVSANIFGSGFPRNFIPSFSWGGSHGTTVYKTHRAFETARAMMARRGKELSPEEEAVLEEVFSQTARYRHGG